MFKINITLKIVSTPPESPREIWGTCNRLHLKYEKFPEKWEIYINFTSKHIKFLMKAFERFHQHMKKRSHECDPFMLIPAIFICFLLVHLYFSVCRLMYENTRNAIAGLPRSQYIPPLISVNYHVYFTLVLLAYLLLSRLLINLSRCFLSIEWDFSSCKN